MFVLPSVRASADRLVMPQGAAPAAIQIPYLPGNRPVSLAISPVHGGNVHVATMPRSETRSVPATPSSIGPTAAEKEMLPKPRRMTREGCEAPLSSLVGPEARRMVPGRCMA
ncbi:hypothetical protein GCM10007887_15800 [Methylobacterium haplocladii]|uniref:Uncharacterized protein n=1 Tax=Methylobacterium haplocladii TaxID=1176176 RepID=A0A512IP04_9HYPH|nr:hypothetical protein MHA02_18250 [Methylobacterium haplocladii]GLS58914.1 hypothetical protein GCM10007887_15800 [Methylobacterium haplocladii]